MTIVKGFYYQPKKLRSTQTWILKVLDVNILDLQYIFFQEPMMSNVQWPTNQPMDLNPMSKLWKNFFSNAPLCVQLFEFMKVVELVEVQIMGFVKDEKTFSTLT